MAPSSTAGLKAVAESAEVTLPCCSHRTLTLEYYSQTGLFRLHLKHSYNSLAWYSISSPSSLEARNGGSLFSNPRRKTGPSPLILAPTFPCIQSVTHLSRGTPSLVNAKANVHQCQRMYIPHPPISQEHFLPPSSSHPLLDKFSYVESEPLPQIFCLLFLGPCATIRFRLRTHFGPLHFTFQEVTSLLLRL